MDVEEEWPQETSEALYREDICGNITAQGYLVCWLDKSRRFVAFIAATMNCLIKKIISRSVNNEMILQPYTEHYWS